MKKTGVILFLSFAFLLTGCLGKKTLHFQEETENWEVEYIADIQSEDSESTGVHITYIGEGEAPEHIDYTLDSPTGGGGGDYVLLTDGMVQQMGNFCSGCAVTRKDHEIQVTIEWGEKEETLDLEYIE
ncbi:hypothetical protein LC065_17980 [Halobacillus litoralis]|uniref:hypothetical protein n=1 Tax=Halobacillus litoralis TaxID=45668 RepID=UPI001CFC9E63|nr:hypothetical protein [Halobacillus litoralis]WLR47380.1 hypothetical protein LC065_17980 [Halobacillus litoralis]